MAERLKDKEDKALEAMFRSEPVADDGFSVNVVSRVRRRLWVRRLSLPLAFTVGAIVSAKPLLQLVELIPRIVGIVPDSLLGLFDLQLSGLPQLSTIVLGIMLLAARPIGDFVDRHPTIKILALSFLILVGVTLIVEGFDVHVPKGYIYFAMAFSVTVEMLNIRMRKKAEPVKLHKQYSD